MLTIRLARRGAKKKPFYTIVATDSRNPRDGKFIERLGFFNPVAHGQEKRLEMNMERINYWQGNGAQISGRVSSLIKDFKAQQLAEVDHAAPAAEAAPAEA